MKLDPGYQREGGIWTLERRQLLIDSILNGFDVPPIYLHRLRPPEFVDDKAATYAVVDGRQRLEALASFADGHFALSKEFVLLEESEDAPTPLLDEATPIATRYGGKTIQELEILSPAIAYRFYDYSVPVTVIEAEQPEIIEELFFRLNEGVPLTSAEKRTRGALLREQIVPLIEDGDVFRSAKFRNKRRTHEDLLIRLLFLAHADADVDRVPDLKKRALDEFAESFRPSLGSPWTPSDEEAAKNELRALLAKVRPTLQSLDQTFEENDPLLGTVNTFMVYYLVIQQLLREDITIPPRESFVQFNHDLRDLSGIAEDELTADQSDALDFAQPIQGSTTGSYFQRKASVLYRYLKGELRISH